MSSESDRQHANLIAVERVDRLAAASRRYGARRGRGAGALRAHAAARRTTDHLGPHVGSAAGRADRGDAARRLGRQSRRSCGHPGRGGDSLRSVSSPFDRRPDGRGGRSIDGGIADRRGSLERCALLLDPQRGFGQGDALRRLRARGPRTSAVLERRDRAARQPGAGARRGARLGGAVWAGHPDGRRGSQPQPGRLVAALPPPRTADRPRRRVGRTSRTRAHPPRHELARGAESADGGVEGDHPGGARHRGLLGGLDHGAQRHRLRRPRLRPRRPLVHRRLAGAAGGALSRFHRGRLQPRHRRLGDHRNRRHRRLRHGRRAGDRQAGGRHAADGAQLTREMSEICLAEHPTSRSPSSASAARRWASTSSW